MNHFYKKNKLTPIINVSGFMTKIGASICKNDNIKAAKEILPFFVNIDELQLLASKRISKQLGCESAVITASSSSALTESVAATITGKDLQKIYKLPNTQDLKNKVLIQQGHLTNYGAEVGQAIRLSGAKILKCGSKLSCHNEDVINKIKKNINSIACAMYVVSHHCSDYNSLNIKTFIKTCKRFKIPLIVDAASEEYMEDFFIAGADMAIFSSHKFMGSLTAGIVAGKKKYIRNVYLQNLGIGRGMKVGKEGIYSSISAVENWYKRNIKNDLFKQKKIISYWLKYLDTKNYQGIGYEVIPDPTGNKINRLRIHINYRQAKFTPQSLAFSLEKNSPSIYVRDDLIHQDHFELDACNLKSNEEKIVMKEMHKIIIKLQQKKLKHNIFHKEYRKLATNNWENWLN